ncbi:MAG: LysM peptidoglycan-binding domain-containing protein [Lachnospiraceae bacterium]|nr:LysM peptidoglycan-binding domain-containing protein [Lachnospiraceae bacterium]
MNKAYKSNHILKRNISCLLFTLALVIILAFTFFKIASKAGEDSEPAKYKYFTQVVVQYGESLSDIADRYYSEDFNNKNNYIQEIRNLNSLYSSEVTAGTYLIIPYFDCLRLP